MNESSHLNLLLISYAFPPFNSAAALNTGKTTAALLNKGWDITALTIDYGSSLDRVDDDLLDALKKVIIVRTASFEKLLLKPVNPSLRRYSYGGVRRMLRFIGISEIQYLWYPNAYRIGSELISKNHYDLLYSSAFNTVSNVVALALKRKFGIPWVAHFSDPWVDSPFIKFNPLEEKFSRYYERKIIAEADAVTFTTQRIVDVVMNKYPDNWRGKVHVIPHGFEKIVRKSGSTKGRDQKFHLVYTGEFYGERTPITVYQALKNFDQKSEWKNKLLLTIISRHPQEARKEAEKLGIRHLVNFHENLSYADTQEIASSANLLVLIDAPYNGKNMFLPGKLMDYMSLEKPILGVTPRDGATADLLSELGYPVVEPNDIEGIGRAIEAIYQNWVISKDDVASAVRDRVANYAIDKTTDRLAQIFQTVLRQGSNE